MLNNFENNLKVAVFGSHGGIGEALIHQLDECEKVSKIYSFSRSETDFKSNKLFNK